MELFQSDSGYRYNSDTLLLFDFIRSFAPKGSLLDVGCGCGILGLLLKRDFPSLHVSLIDIQKGHCVLAEANATHNALTLEKVTCNDFLELSHDQKFDTIVSNPPFYHKGSVKSDDKALGIARYSTYLPFDALAHKASKMLSNKGYFTFCYDAKQLQHVFSALSDAKLNVEALCCVHTKADNDASLILVRARKNSKTLCKVFPPRIVGDSEGYLAPIKAIFEHANTKSLSWKD
ncbi:MAG: methyltransferase [Sulfurovum sp. FS06-10]|nr:MAG: methyltransferase [Sulfurovum sp. FS06-10]